MNSNRMVEKRQQAWLQRGRSAYCCHSKRAYRLV